MKYKLVLLLLVALFSCAKSKAPSNAALKATDPSKEAAMPRGYAPQDGDIEETNSLSGLEALIERDLGKLGLPSLRETPTLQLEAEDKALVSPAPTTGAIMPEATRPTTKSDDIAKQPTAANSAGAGKKQGEPEQQSCQKVCSLVDNICDAAVRICQITEKFPNDPEAPQRCTRAQNACTRAKKQGVNCPCNG